MFKRKIKLRIATEKFKDFMVDYSFSIMQEDTHIGNIHVNILTDDTVHIEWVELFSSFRGKGYFREVLSCLMEHFDIDKLSLEASKDTLAMYTHLGAVINEYDDFREMTSLYIYRDALGLSEAALKENTMKEYDVKLIMSEEYRIKAETKEEAVKEAKAKFGSDYYIDDVEVKEVEPIRARSSKRR